MHETSLIQYTLNAVEQKALTMSICHVCSIRLVIGGMRGALPNLMQHAFKMLCRSRPLFFDAALDIIECPVVLQCNDCNNKYTIVEFHAITCPDCWGTEYTVVQGNELYIDSFEGE